MSWHGVPLSCRVALGSPYCARLREIIFLDVATAAKKGFHFSRRRLLEVVLEDVGCCTKRFHGVCVLGDEISPITRAKVGGVIDCSMQCVIVCPMYVLLCAL